MTVYIDVVLLINFLLDLLLLITTTIILKRRTKIYRLLLGALFGTITTLTLFIPINSATLFLLKIFISLIMVLISFSYRSLKYTIQNMCYLYLISIVLGGSLYLLNIQFSYQQQGLTIYQDGIVLNILLLLIISPIILYLYTKETKKLKLTYSNYYPVSIYLKDKSIIHVTGFLDTGNHLHDPYTHKPILLVNASCIPKTEEKTILVPYHALNNSSMLKCIKPQKVVINGVGTKTNVLIGIATEKINIEGIDCILHPKLF